MNIPWLTVSLIAALCLTSVLVWLGIARHRAGIARLLRRSRRAPEVFIWPIVLMGIWLLHQLLLELDGWLTDAPPSPFRPEEILDGMRYGCLIQAVALMVFGLTLTGGSPSVARSFGAGMDHLGGQVRRGGLTVTAAWLPVFAALLATFPLRSVERQHPVLRLLQEQPSFEAYGWAILSAVLLAPLFEELVFRVILQSWLTARLGFAGGLWLASLVFAGVHGFPDSLAIVPLALVLGSAWRLTGSYWTIVTAHALFNAVMLILDATLPEG